jgi:hypothetical protein
MTFGLKMRMMAGLALLAATAMTMWAGDQDFTLVNKTGFTISSLYVAAAKDRDWGEDILGEDELSTGKTLDIEFNGYGKKVCTFDVLIKDQDDKEWIVEGINLCEIHNLTFTKKGKSVIWTAN